MHTAHFLLRRCRRQGPIWLERRIRLYHRAYLSLTYPRIRFIDVTLEQFLSCASFSSGRAAVCAVYFDDISKLVMSRTTKHRRTKFAKGTGNKLRTYVFVSPPFAYRYVCFGKFTCHLARWFSYLRVFRGRASIMNQKGWCI